MPYDLFCFWSKRIADFVPIILCFYYICLNNNSTNYENDFF